MLVFLLGKRVRKTFNIFIFIFAIFSSVLFAEENKVIISVPEEWSTSLISIKELLKESYSDIGYTVSFVELPLSRSIIELINGKIDGELLNSQAIGQKYGLTIVTPPYFTVKTYAYYLREKFKKVPTIDEIKKGRIGYLRGFVAADNFFSNTQSPTIVNNDKQLFSLLNKNRVDFVISITPSFATKEKNFGRVLLFEISNHHILSKKNSELAKKIGPSLKKNLVKKKYDHLQEQVRDLILKKSEQSGF